jgi:hypothetical protein
VKCQVHAVLAGAGVAVPMSDLFGQQGQQLLEWVGLSVAARARVNSAQRIIEALDFEIDTFADLVAHRLHRGPCYAAVQQIPGVGPVLAVVFVAEIGDVDRFPGPAQPASWAGLTRSTTSPTPPCTAAALRSRGRGWCAGRRSRRCSGCPATLGWGRSGRTWAGAGAATSGSWPPPVSWSGWSSTACVITTSAAYPPAGPA